MGHLNNVQLFQYVLPYCDFDTNPIHQEHQILAHNLNNPKDLFASPFLPAQLSFVRFLHRSSAELTKQVFLHFLWPFSFQSFSFQPPPQLKSLTSLPFLLQSSSSQLLPQLPFVTFLLLLPVLFSVSLPLPPPTLSFQPLLLKQSLAFLLLLRLV